MVIMAMGASPREAAIAGSTFLHDFGSVWDDACMKGSDFLSLDPAAAPVRGRTGWLAERLREAIAAGALTPGVRLPATRDLASELSFSRGTVVEAYRRLTEEGLLSTNRGGGTVVEAHLGAGTPMQPGPGQRTRPGSGTSGGPGTGASSGAGPAPTGAPGTVPPAGHLLDISKGAPDLSAFPRAAWLRAERAVLTGASPEDLGYADPQGVPELREALAGWLARSRGVTVGPERIIITAGVTGALSLLAQVMRERGVSECAVEDPGAEGNRRILGFWLDRLHPVPVDAEGMDVAALTASDARMALVTPAHQFPTGVTLSPDRRRDLIAWAEATEGLVVEDDYDSEYRYDRAPVRAMHASATERIVHISSLSKVIAPALRLGWMIAPRHLHDDLVRRRWATDLGSPALPQLTLAELITSGVLERQLRSLRRRHRDRRDAAVAAIGRWLPGSRIEGIAAGLHLHVGLPAEVDDAEVSARARERGIAVQPLSALRFSPGSPGLIIGYGPHSPATLEQAIRTLGEIVSG
ncbi:MocR-like pyridoxine biosynthesis transcription factor PdxR [Brevibacterium metallidurans]|uniref:PLP-dependent aminotransferase family protein n=1 Tax=Brevibacterium metallidurans TaxID=1482676 RepID=A0ABN0SIT5_9MICO